MTKVKKNLDKIGSDVDKHKENALVISHVGPFTSTTLEQKLAISLT